MNLPEALDVPLKNINYINQYIQNKRHDYLNYSLLYEQLWSGSQSSFAGVRRTQLLHRENDKRSF